jgi:hypothetical protein
MRRLLFLFCFIVISTTTIAQVNYDVNLISKTLLPYASAVIRNKEVTIEVKGLENTTYHIKTAITVLNKNGDDQAHIVVWHNNSNIIKSIKGVVYDEFSKPISKFSESNFEDVNAGNDFSLFEDSRVKHYIPSVTNYPYTIEYEYELKSKQSLNFQDWKPNPGTGLAVEKSSFTFICKPDFNIRYKEINLPGQAVIINIEKGVKTYTWKVANLKAVKDEPYSPNPDTYLSSVKIAPEKFTYEGISGSFTNWNELGKWIYDKLLLNRDELWPETVAYLKNLTQNIADPKQKARKLYEFMQQKTRYISVQVGIGGYQPFKAEDVDRLSYGDCKALVNYMQALLKAVGINSYYCVVESGNNKTSMLPDFASMDQGNHIILCVPFKNDTTWLECTNQKIPFGYLGSFTADRTVLACTPQGGILLHTPKYIAQNNLQLRKGTFTLNEKGELAGNMGTIFKGTQYDNRESLIEESPVEQVKGLKHIYPINNLGIEKYNFKQDKSLDPVTTENLKFTAPDYASVEQNKIYFMLNPVNRTGRTPREVRTRLNPVYIYEGYTDEDEINYTVPKGYHLEKIPLQVAINKPFGSYHATMSLKDGQLLYTRKIQLIDGTYSKDTYQELVDFYKEVADADNYSVTLVKNIN